MPFITTSQEWLTQSALLLEARPTTARVTTKYNIKPAKIRKAKKDAADTTDTTTTTTTTTTTKPPRATLILKTFDPHSGVCLKYKTTKAAEVSRLVQLLGSLGRKMAALPDAPVAAAEEEPAVAAAAAAAAAAVAAVATTRTATPPVVGTSGGAAAGQAPQQGGGGGGKGKKKKGGKR
ncbi:hypothetical protein VM1G_00203 [Cytospora mali]|uniref:SRP9 domain-containing protein n=1 Tax=Cytospora mali TaxID=578113 RepID=A0A194VMQ2_CYTMA|nr:hypothetical protein VM1G_00203 [Valsa mali]